MSFNQNYGTYFTPYAELEEQDDANYELEVLEASIENHVTALELEERELRKTWRILYEK